MSESAPPKSTAPVATPASVDFGYTEVPRAEKARRVRAVFDSVADKYDIMNDLMSAGVHRLWKRYTLGQTGLRPGPARARCRRRHRRHCRGHGAAGG